LILAELFSHVSKLPLTGATSPLWDFHLYFASFIIFVFSGQIKDEGVNWEYYILRDV